MKKTILKITFLLLIILSHSLQAQDGYTYTLKHNGGYSFSVEAVPNTSTNNFATKVQSYGFTIILPDGITIDTGSTSSLGGGESATFFNGGDIAQPTIDGYLVTETLGSPLAIDAPSSAVNSTMYTFTVNGSPTTGSMKILENNSTIATTVTPLKSFMQADMIDNGADEFVNVVDPNASAVSGTSEIDFATLVSDTTPPVFENSTPSASSITDTSFTLNTDIDEVGTIYYVVVADGATAPTVAEVQAGTGNGGSGQVSAGSQLVDSGGFTKDFSVTGLTAGTSYDVYVVAEDDETTPNVQASVIKVDVATTGGCNLNLSIASQNNVACNGGTDGAVTISASGGTSPYQYSKDGTNFQTNNTFNSLGAGSHTLTVKDANNCTATITATITEPSALSITVVSVTPADNSISSNGSSLDNGAITVSFSGGTAPYTYYWSNGAFNTTTVTGLTSTTYTFYLEDANGCTASKQGIRVPAIAHWNGSTDNNWEDSSNWRGSHIPTIYDDVVLPSGLMNYPTASNAVTFNKMTMNPGASFIPGGTVTGEVTYQGNLPTTDWYLVGAPLSGETIEDIIAGHTFASGTGANIGIAAYDNSAASQWNYLDVTSTGTVFSGAGVSVKLAVAGDLTMSGTANTNNVSFPIATGTQDNFNLLSNPFLAYADSITFTTDNTGLLSEETLWLWDGTQYVTYNVVNPIDLAPGQGFFVEAGASGNVIFNTLNQNHQDVAMRQTPLANFELFVDNGSVKKSTKVFYVGNKTTGFDNGYDSKLFSGISEEFKIYTDLLEGSEGKQLAIQTLPNKGFEDMVIPVGVEATSGSSLSFSLSSFDLPTGVDVYLEDREKGVFTKIGQSTYSVTLSNDVKGLGRFYVHTSAKALSVNGIDTLSGVSMFKSANDVLTIYGLTTDAKVQVYSLVGKEVFTTQLQAKATNSVELPKVAKGIYVVKLLSENGELNKKIVIE